MDEDRGYIGPDPYQTVAQMVPGQVVLERYALERVLGRGGFGVVWLALDTELDMPVAIKFLSDVIVSNPEAVNDLKRETRFSLRLTHPNIVRIYGFLQSAMLAGISMEYVDGGTLSALKAQRPERCFDAEILAPLVEKLCDALEYAHRHVRIAHRDLKPGNLMVDSGGNLKVADFGISRSISDTHTALTHVATSGTPAFMSPQQMLGEPARASDDIYSLGATLYDLLAGKPPFYSGDVLAQLREARPVSIATRRAELGISAAPVPPAWERVVLACLEKDPKHRPHSAAEVAKHLGLHVGRHGHAGAPPASSATEEHGDAFLVTPTESTRIAGVEQSPSGAGDGGPAGMSSGTRPARADDAGAIDGTAAAARGGDEVAQAGRVVGLGSPEPAVSRPRDTAPGAGRRLVLPLLALGLVVLGYASWRLIAPDSQPASSTGDAGVEPAQASGGSERPDPRAQEDGVAAERSGADRQQGSGGAPPSDDASTDAHDNAVDGSLSTDDVGETEGSPRASADGAASASARELSGDGVVRRDETSSAASPSGESAPASAERRGDGPARDRDGPAGDAPREASGSPPETAEREAARRDESEVAAGESSGNRSGSDGPPALSDAQAIQALLTDYRAALETVDLARFSSLWKAMDGRKREQFERAFRELQSQDIDWLREPVLAIEGERATARLSEKRTMIMKVGNRLESQLETELVLERTGAGWKIVNLVAR